MTVVFYFLNGYRFDYDDEVRTILKEFGTDEAAVDEGDTTEYLRSTPRSWIWPVRSRSGEANSSDTG
ncbi:MAG: hypothetical protein ACQET5_16030 [Halobacteriota archaeon]